MRYTLKDYQSDAVAGVLRNLEQARDAYHRYGARSQFSLSATTGAGKTVMAAAVIEALFFGADEFNFQADPGAVVLWFSDDPSLNEQSRGRLQAASSELDGRLRVIETTFSETTLRPGHVYFLNTQKLSKNSRLVRGDRPAETTQDPLLHVTAVQERLLEVRPDQMQATIYDVIQNTMDDSDLTLYLVLDEAHRGMGNGQRDRATIVQRLINGANGIAPMPVVFGISATVENFDKAMRDIKSRTALPSVEVDSRLVQESGLLKDDIVLSIPAEKGSFDTVLLRRAVDKIRAASAEWATYATAQAETTTVAPLLVVQVEDKASTERLLLILDTIYQAWPELGVDAIAHVFGEHTDLLLGQVPVPYIEPQRVQDATHVRVLLAKTAISTGWDCPRAEVLVSFRPAQDRTHITQLLGRMMRTPLARRIPGNELLNSVDCLLPFFDTTTATQVAEMLMKGATGKDEDTGGGEGRRVLFQPVELTRNPDVPDPVWHLLASLPTVTIPKRGAKPIRRLTALATALATDALVPDAVATAHTKLHQALDGRAVQYADQVEASRRDVLSMTGQEARGRYGAAVTYTSFEESADTRAIEDSYRTAARALSPALCSSYVDHRAGADSDEDELLEATITVAALGLVPQIVQEIEAHADTIARDWLDTTRIARKGLPDHRQAEYDRLEAQSTHPEQTALTLPERGQAESMERRPDGSEVPLPTRGHHLLAASDLSYPIDLNDWETRVLDQELAQPSFVAWYRNPARASKESLAIAYRDDQDTWRALRPDFVFFHRHHDGTIVADLVDPHSHHLADALAKLRGLADFTEQHGHAFRRVEAIADIAGTLRVLDLTTHTVRDAIRAANNAETLYQSQHASTY